MRSISPAAEAVYGIPPSQIIGQHLARLVHPHDAATVSQQLAAALRQPAEPVALSFNRLTSSGGYTGVRFVGWVSMRHGRPTGIVGRETPAVGSAGTASGTGAAETGGGATTIADDTIASSRSGVALAGGTPRVAAGGAPSAVTVPTSARTVGSDRVLPDKVLHNAGELTA